MFKNERNYHQRLQEFCDCYLETDPRKELEKAAKGISGDPGGDPDELALKFLGLGVFYGVSEKAKKLTIERFKDGKVQLTVKSKDQYQLSPPGTQIADRIISIARAITHVDGDEGRQAVSMGIRNDRMELTFEFRRTKGDEKFTILFPEL